MSARLLLAALLLVPAAAGQQAAPLTPQQQQRETPLTRVARTAGAAVVNVYQKVDQELPSWARRIYGVRSVPRSSLGSGFLIDPDGYILTNAHVVELDSNQGKGISVRLADASEYPAELVNVDPDNDVALLKITPPPGHSLPVVDLGTSSDVMVGESIVAIGNPLGNENTVTSGIVSSVYREVQVPDQSGQAGPRPVFHDYIQVDAAINPGNSGGPLLNALGEVIGINFAIENQAEGIGFAIPIDRVRHTLIENLLNPRMKHGVVTGLDLQRDPQGKGVLLSDVDPDGPAEKAGLRAGDHLVSVAGKPVHWEFDFNKALLAMNQGDRVDVVVERDGRTVKAALQLGHDDSPQPVVWSRMGLIVVDHPRFKGVRVERVDPTGPATALGLAAGDLIDGLDDDAIDSTADLFRLIRSRPAGASVVVHVWRGNGASFGTLHLR